MERIFEAIVAVLRELHAICDELPWIVLDWVLVTNGNRSRGDARHAAR